MTEEFNSDMANTKYTPAKGKSICKLVAAGVTVEAAAGVEGVVKGTVYNWKKAHAEFNAALNMALSKAESDVTQHVVKRAKEDWRAGAWWLERRRPEVYGESSKVVHRVKLELEGLMDVAQKTLDPDSYRKLLRATGGDREK